MQSDTPLQCIQRTISLCEMQLNTSHDLSTIRPGLFGFYLSYDVLPTVNVRLGNVKTSGKGFIYCFLAASFGVGFLEEESGSIEVWEGSCCILELDGSFMSGQATHWQPTW